MESSNRLELEYCPICTVIMSHCVCAKMKELLNSPMKEIEVKEWFDWTEEDLLDDEKQKQIFGKMLRVLENDGHCREVFHRLASLLFNDSMEN